MRLSAFMPLIIATGKIELFHWHKSFGVGFSKGLKRIRNKFLMKSGVTTQIIPYDPFHIPRNSN